MSEKSKHEKAVEAAMAAITEVLAKDEDAALVQYFEINVAQRMAQPRNPQHVNHRHLFATHARSLRNYREAAEVWVLIKERFPAPEFRVEMSAQYEYGRQVGI